MQAALCQRQYIEEVIGVPETRTHNQASDVKHFHMTLCMAIQRIFQRVQGRSQSPSLSVVAGGTDGKNHQGTDPNVTSLNTTDWPR